jgi:hypothetical protein
MGRREGHDEAKDAKNPMGKQDSEIRVIHPRSLRDRYSR